MDNAEVILQELNEGKDLEKSYRNALRLLLLSSKNDIKSRSKVKSLNARSNTINSLFIGMFGNFCFEKEENKLFSESQIDDINAEIKGDSISSQFSNYLHGYREAADIIVKIALINGNEQTKGELIFPICFLYRQYIELTLKDLYLYYSMDSEEEKNAFMRNTNHKLINFWNDKIVTLIKPLLVNKNEKKDFNFVSKYINEFSEIDIDSFVFRYPINKKRTLYHKKPRKINILALMERMEFIEGFFADMSAELDFTKCKILNT